MMTDDIQAWRRARRPIAFFFGAFGDHLLARPGILALQRIFEGRLSFAGTPAAWERFYPDAGFRSVHAIRMGATNNAFAFDPAQFETFASDFDAFINLNWWESDDNLDIVRRFPDIPHLRLASHGGRLAPLTDTAHMADSAFVIARYLDDRLHIDDFATLPPPSTRSIALCRQLRDRLPAHARLLVVHTHTKSDKEWDAVRFRSVLERFLDSHDDHVAVVIDPDDRGLDFGRHERRVFSIEGMDLAATTALVATADLFLGVDSYFLHVADFARVPTVGLFGPTSPALWGCRFTRARHVAAKSMSDIGVDAVLDHLHALARIERVSA